MGEAIEAVIADENWVLARRLINRELRRTPDDHWLLTRLSLTYYEQRNYKQALKISERALDLAPRCPLILWDYAGTLDMLGRTAEAIRIYQKIIRRGADSLAHGECGEGMAWARGMLADCYFRMGLCYGDRGNRSKATVALRKHLSLRRLGCRSIYDIRTARKHLAAMRK